MRKLLLSLVFLALTFSSIGCNQASANSIVKIKDDGIEEPVPFTKEGNIQESSSIPNSTQDVVRDNAGFVLVDQQSKDINNDGTDENIKVFSLYDDGQRLCLRVKVMINSSVKVFEFDKNTTLNGLKKIHFVNLGNKKTGIMIPLYATEDETPYMASIHNGCIVVGYENNEMITLLDAVNQPINEEDNYNVRYLGDFTIEFIDKATNFHIAYKLPDTYNFDKNESEKRLQHLNDTEYPSKVSIDYYQIKTQDFDSDGVDEVVCYKFIPGIYHNDALGVISYTFKFTNNKYELKKETLQHWNSDAVIKSMKIKSLSNTGLQIDINHGL